MKIQDYIADVTKLSFEEVFRYARTVPEEKLEWIPAGEARSALDVCRELAMTPRWALEIISPGEFITKAELDESSEERNSWKSVAECEAKGRVWLADLEKLYRGMPDERLSETKWLPYEGGRDFTMLEMMEYPRWNFNYHLGQIAYIQRMYGDTDMH